MVHISNSKVLIINVVDKSSADKFNEAIKSQPCMVLYSAEWCGHCKALKKEWHPFIEQMKTESKKGLIAHVDSESMKHLSPEVHKEVRGFPTILRLKSGGALDKEYNSPRDTEHLKRFALETFGMQRGGRRKRHRRKSHYRKKKKRNRKTGGRRKTRKKRHRHKRRVRRTRKFRKR